MQNHYYDDTHPLRPYTYSLDAMPGTLPPANALRGDKPTAPAGYWPGESNGAWVDIEDHRGAEGYLNGQPHTIADVGPLPEGWSTTPPPLTPEEQATQRKAEILARLAAIDAARSRPLGDLALGQYEEFARAKLAALETERTALAAELAGLEQAG
jgi:hypothetical protein